MTTNPIRLTAAAGAALALAVPAAAQATSLVYRDGNDVWVSNLDGTQKRQVTADGSAARPYDHPSSDDAGTVYAIRTGSNGDATIELRPIKDAGSSKALPWSDPKPGSSPTDAEVNGSGNQLLFVWDHKDPGDGFVESTLGVANPSQANPNRTFGLLGVPRASFYRDRLLVSSFNSSLGVNQIYAETSRPKFDRFLANPDGLDAMEMSRTAEVGMLAQSDGDLELLAMDGAAPPFTEPTASCIAPSGTDRYAQGTRFSVSADGSHIAWSNGNGVYTAKVPASITSETCALTEIHQVSATGGEPSLSEGPTGYVPPKVEETPTPTPSTVPTAVPTTSPTVVPTATATATATPPTPVAKLTVAKRSRKAALKKGIKVSVSDGTAAAAVSVRVKKGAKTLGAGTLKLDGAGSGSVRVKLASSAKRVLKKGRKVTLTVTAGALTATVTVR